MKNFNVPPCSTSTFPFSPTHQSRIKSYLKHLAQAVFIFFALALAACGGGGGGGGTTPQQPNSNWDQMVWGQDDWS